MTEGGELAVVEQQQPTTLIYETNPVTILEDSKKIAKALADIIKDRKLYTTIQGKDYVHVEGWTTLGALVKVFPILDWSKRLDRESGEIIYESRVITQTIRGEIIGIGEALASSSEKTKKGKARWVDEYAIKSMSITRATSKALRIPLGWIMVLAGYEGTPFEEMTKDMNKQGKPAPAQGKRKPAPVKKPAPARASEDAANDAVDADYKIKNKPGAPETYDMTSVDLETLKGINKNLDKWIKTCQEKDELKTIKQVCGWCEGLIDDKKLTLEEFKGVKKALGMKLK